MYKALSPGAIGVGVQIEDCVKLARKNGFQGIYFDVRWAAEAGATRALETLDGLRPAAFGLPFDYRSGTVEFTEYVNELSELAEVAAAMGCTRCSTWVPSWNEEMDYEENFQFHRRRLQWIGNVLSAQGIYFGLEFIGPKTCRTGHRYEFIHTMSEMLRLCREVVSSKLGLLLDSWHWYTSGGTLEEIGKLRKEQVVDVHINDAPAGIPVDEQIDSVRALPGETGVIDLAGFLGALKAIGYDGPVMAEPFSQRVRDMPAEEAVAATARAIQSVWPD
jgi:sugar phosphate isomerase/epimerase